MKKVDIKIELSGGAAMPVYAHEGDAGLDIRNIEDIVLKPGETILAKTGIKVALPVGYEFQVRPRSGLSLKTNLVICNSPGTIDSNYRGEIGIILKNDSVLESFESYLCEYDINYVKNKLNAIYKIPAGTRIAQLILNEVPVANFIQVESIEDDTERGSGGFGSTKL